MPAVRAPADDGSAPSPPWTELAIALPTYHARLSDEPSAFVTEVLALPDLRQLVSVLDLEGRRRLALDVLMVDAFARRHAASVSPAATEKLETAAFAVAESLEIPPMLTYPLYICQNPPELPFTRRFTPTEDEFRFIRMHRLIEDTLEAVIEAMDEIVRAADPRGALLQLLPVMESAYRRANSTVAAFRSDSRIDRRTFTEEFRPYYLGGERRGEHLEGPSGLQSPTFRLLAMRAGYEDLWLDGLTIDVGRYHEPATRQRLQRFREERDAGLALRRIEEGLFGAEPPQPHLHPEYGAHSPRLTEIALARELVSPDIRAVLGSSGVDAATWPNRGPVPAAIDPTPLVAPELEPAGLAVAGALATVEAMMHAFHLEHVATTAHHIGAAAGTGGTEGVNFLLIAAFRRAFPRVWLSGLGAEVGDPA